MYYSYNNQTLRIVHDFHAQVTKTKRQRATCVRPHRVIIKHNSKSAAGRIIHNLYIYTLANINTKMIHKRTILNHSHTSTRVFLKQILTHYIGQNLK